MLLPPPCRDEAGSPYSGGIPLSQAWRCARASSLLPHQGGTQYPSTGFCTLTKTMMKARDSEGQHHARVDMTQHRLCSTETAHAHGPCRGRHHERRRIWLQKCPAKGFTVILLRDWRRIQLMQEGKRADPKSKTQENQLRVTQAASAGKVFESTPAIRSSHEAVLTHAPGFIV